MTYRYNQDNGDWCSATYQSPLGGPPGSPVHGSFKEAFCCPTGKAFSNCNWSNDPASSWSSQPGNIITPDILCKPQACLKGQTQVTSAIEPPVPNEVNNLDINPPLYNGPNAFDCSGLSLPPDYDQAFPYCCDPPSVYSDNWPVDPKDLWATYYDAPNSDVMWSYADNFPNNNADSSQEGDGTEDGSDAYGFIMLDGDTGSLDNEFGSTHTITRRSVEIPKVKRSVLTTNSSVLDSTFDHAEEIIHVYCNYPQDSPECQHVWIDGAEDTIVRLPNHVGDGPFARIVYMRLADESYQLPKHHIESRSLERNDNPIWVVKIDYNFQLIKRTSPVNIRVDYTNLLGYWGSITDSPPSSRKRSVSDEHLQYAEWRSRVDSAKEVDKQLRKRSSARDGINSTTEVFENMENKGVRKRWFGAFGAWLSKLVSVTAKISGHLINHFQFTVESKNVGYISMAFQQTVLLYQAMAGCVFPHPFVLQLLTRHSGVQGRRSPRL